VVAVGKVLKCDPCHISIEVRRSCSGGGGSGGGGSGGDDGTCCHSS